MLMIDEGIVVHGITLHVNDMISVNNFYETAKTQEYLVENYEMSELEAKLLAQAVRERIKASDESISELDALVAVARDENMELTERRTLAYV